MNQSLSKEKIEKVDGGTIICNRRVVLQTVDWDALCDDHQSLSKIIQPVTFKSKSTNSTGVLHFGHIVWLSAYFRPTNVLHLHENMFSYVLLFFKLGIHLYIIDSTKGGMRVNFHYKSHRRLKRNKGRRFMVTR